MMCDCRPAAEMADAHWAVKLITGLIAGGLIFAVVTDPRGWR